VSFLLTVPETLDDRGFETLAAGWVEGKGEHLLLDARHVRWVSPYGILGLLAIGTAWRNRVGERSILKTPETQNVMSYLARIGFYDLAKEIFEIEGPIRRRVDGESDALLEITAIRSHQDVHGVVDRVKDRAAAILARLGYPQPSVVQFSVILSEVCQNIVEHANGDGWVAAQTYNWKARLGRLVVVIGVMDVGIGFRGSLAREHAQTHGDHWSDAKALESAFLHGLSRFRDPGRGQGLQAIRVQTSKWQGLVTIRSGTAQISEVPDWIEKKPLISGLPDFPGAQIQVVVPQVSPSGGDREGGRGNG
jgi:anti-sigma regulatory factor (Ser/Thr protein kinase)